MRKTLLLIVLLQTAFAAYSQTYHRWATAKFMEIGNRRYDFYDSTFHEYSLSPAYLATNIWNSDTGKRYTKPTGQVIHTHNYSQTFTPAGYPAVYALYQLYGGVQMPVVRTTKLYDNSNNLLREETEFGSVFSPLTGGDLKEYKYTSAGLIDTVTEYYFDHPQQMYIPTYRTLYAHLGGQLAFEQEEEYTGTWDPLNRTFHTYAANRLHESRIEEYVNGGWEQVRRKRFFYNASSNIIAITTEKWDGVSNWIYDTDEQFSYDANNKELSYEKFEWIGSSWTPVKRKLSTYSIDGQILTEKYDTYDPARQVYYTVPGDEFIRYQYVDETGIPGSPTQQKLQLRVFPSPAIHQLNLAFANDQIQPYTATLHDMAGRLVKSFKGNGNSTFQVRELPAGNYILQVQSGDAIFRERISLMH